MGDEEDSPRALETLLGFHRQNCTHYVCIMKFHYVNYLRRDYITSTFQVSRVSRVFNGLASLSKLVCEMPPLWYSPKRLRLFQSLCLTRRYVCVYMSAYAYTYVYKIIFCLLNSRHIVRLMETLCITNARWVFKRHATFCFRVAA